MAAPWRTLATANRLKTVLAISLFLLVAGALTYRAHLERNIHGEGWILRDFRNNLYYPTVSLLSGNNPYDPERHLQLSPADAFFPLYLPVGLLLHLPFGLMPLRTAEALYFSSALALAPVLALAALVLSGVRTTTARVFGVAAVLLLSRPGHWNVLVGQATAQLVLGAYVALHCARKRPWLAGLGFAVTMFKPTFGLPLALLMLARREGKAVFVGLVVTLVTTFATLPFLVEAAGGVKPFVSSVAANQAVMAQAINHPAQQPARSDAVTLLSRLLWRPLSGTTEIAITFAVLLLGVVAVRALVDVEDERLRRLSSGIICLVVVTCTYHQAYDLLLLAFPVAALAAGTWTSQESKTGLLRWGLLTLLLVPAANYLASFSAVDALSLTGVWLQVVLCLNGVVLVAALFLYLAVALRQPAPTSPV